MFILFAARVAAQPPLAEWAVQFGPPQVFDTWNNNGRGVEVDQQGNVYSIGLFFYTADLDPGPGIFNLTAGNASHQAIYLSKLSATGAFIWAKQLDIQVQGRLGLTIDRAANIYITGQLKETTDMDPGPGVVLLTPIGLSTAFLLKLDPDGNLTWVKQFGGTIPGTAPFGSWVTIDDNDNVIVCGGFNQTVDFDPGPGTFNLTGGGNSEAFIVKLTAEGNFLWARQLGILTGVYDEVYIEDVRCGHDGSIYTTGAFRGDVDFDPGPASYRITSGGPADGFISKLDADGNFAWAKQLGNSAFNYTVQPRGLDLDAAGNVYATGAFMQTQDFDPGPAVYNLSTSGYPAAFILKLNPQGIFIWAKQLGGGPSDNGIDVVIDNHDNLYTIGLFTGDVDFDPASGVSQVNGLHDATVLTKFDPAGNFVYAAPLIVTGSGNAVGRRLTTDALQHIYITGYFGGQVDFDPGPDTLLLEESRGGVDAFVLKLSHCNHVTTSSLNISSCDSFVLNDQRYAASGTYTQQLSNASGCDSIITLNLLIKPAPIPDLGPDRNICGSIPLSLTPGSFNHYLWDDGSTGSSLNVTSPGTYAVEVSNDDCFAMDSVQIPGVVQPPANFLPAVDSICEYGTLFLRPVGTYAKLNWSNGSTESSINVHAAGVYALRVEDFNGCIGADSVEVVERDCGSGLYIPTSFTPNGDGVNDEFHAVVFGDVQKFRLQVFNRNGQVVFSSTDPSLPWKGIYKGAACPPGVFVWQCAYRLAGGRNRLQTGVLMLMR